MKKPPTELRIGVVLNGGVSLAVWIGGVVHELDELRRASPGVQAGYPDALSERHTGARIDVIAGASAGGINGALLAAAIQGTTTEGARPLRSADGGPLRDMWLELGDLRHLTRSPREVDPPSLLRSDEYLVPNLKKQLDALLADESESLLAHPLYLYMSATDLRGTGTARFQTSDGVIEERDHRVVFKFSAKPEPGLGDEAGDPPEGDLMRETLRLESANSERLARAARSSSSFPGAFAPHRVVLERDGGTVTTFLADGGILDNQPIRPLLDRIRLMSVDRPIRRVVLFVVPYVTKERVKEQNDDRRASADSPPGLIEVVQSGGLARDLPKLESLERAEEELSAGRAAQAVNELLYQNLSALVPAAEALLVTYRDVQRSELLQTIDQWDATRETGTGPLGGSERAGIEQTIVARPREMTKAIADSLERDLPSPIWSVATGAQQGVGPWTWGLSKAERFARTAISWLELDGSDDELTDAARTAASKLGIAARKGMEARRTAFNLLRQTIADPVEAFALSYLEIENERNDVQEAVEKLAAALALAFDRGDAQVTKEFLMAVEICTNVAGTRPSPAPVFDFYRVSAQGGVLGHQSDTPDKKLAGMQLGHFAAFLKRSWRANDWMWGRLDAARHIGGLIFVGPNDVEADAWIRARQMVILREELPVVAREIINDEKAGFSEICDFSLWRRAHAGTLAAISVGTDVNDVSVIAAFRQLQLGDELVGEETGARATVATATGLAAVASRALSGDQSGLPGPVRGLIGVTRRTASVTNTLTVTFSRWPAAGFAVILLAAAIAVVLAASDGIAAAWLVPALVAIAVAGAWTGYGWLSSPPRPWRAVVLSLATVGLAVGNVEVNAPGGLKKPGSWFDLPLGAGDAVWWLTIAVGVATVAIVVLYDVSTAQTQKLARRLRGWIGIGLVSLLALLLSRLAWDRIAETDKTSGWEGWFERHTAVRAFLIAGVVLVMLVQVLELLQWRIKSGDEND